MSSSRPLGQWLSTALLAVALGFPAQRLAASSALVVHNAVRQQVTMADAGRNLMLRLNYGGKCILDQVRVRGRDVVADATGVSSGIQVGGRWFTTRADIPVPQVVVSSNRVVVSGIRFGGGGIDVEETWKFTVMDASITWQIDRRYRQGGTLDDTAFPGWDFKDMATWTGALLGHGGVAWPKLFDAPNATYGVHNGKAAFWNKAHSDCLQIVPASPEGKMALRFSRQTNGNFTVNHLVSDRELITKHGQARFLRDREDVWQPFTVAAGPVTVRYVLSAGDYDKYYDRGRFVGLDGRAVREICHTIARIGAIDELIDGSNGYYSGYAVLHEQWIAQLGLAIDDPDYFRAYADTLDYQRDYAIGPDGRVKSRWAYGPGDAMPNTYDTRGFYECQWGWLMDTQPNWVINVAEEFDFSGDVAWVRKHQKTCERGLDYLLKRDSNHNGLVEMMTDSQSQGRSSDWIDVVKASFENALVNAELFQALTLWSDVETILGSRDQAARYAQCARQLKESFNRSIHDGGFWDPARQWYVYWREKDGSIHGNCLVTPVNFMAVAYGLCDDPQRGAAILRQIEDQMHKEQLFIWPLNIFPYAAADASGMTYPTYENGDIFLGWAELGIRAYARYDPAIALRCVKNVLRKYDEDGLAFQRYLRASQKGAGDDILANNCSPVVGLYRNLYGLQPKYNRFYLEPHLLAELNGTQLRYGLRGRTYVIDLSTTNCGISVAGFSVRDTRPFAVNVTTNGDFEYFSGGRQQPSLTLVSPGHPLELRIDSWPASQIGRRQWTVTPAEPTTPLRQRFRDLSPGAEYRLVSNGFSVGTFASDGDGKLAVDLPGPYDRPQHFELLSNTSR